MSPVLPGLPMMSGVVAIEMVPTWRISGPRGSATSGPSPIGDGHQVRAPRTGPFELTRDEMALLVHQEALGGDDRRETVALELSSDALGGPSR